MAIKHDVLVDASKAKRIATMFRNASTVKIPVVVNGQSVEVDSQAIAESCEKCHRELLEEFCSFLTAEEVISQAYRIANATRRRLKR
jgi:hypothetical protein